MEVAYFKNFLHSNALIAFGLMLLAGLVGGRLVQTSRYFPRIIGYIAIGFLLGPHFINLISQDLLDQAKIYEQMAIGLILFELGLQINLKELMSRPILLWTSVIQSTLVFLLIFLGLLFLKVTTIVAALAAALGVSISPAVTLLIAHEYGAKGTVVNHSLILTALNNMIAFAFYAVVVAIAEQLSTEADSHNVIIEWLYPFYQMLGAVLLASILALSMIWIGRFVGKKENLQFILLVSMVVIALGFSKLFYVSPYLTMLTLGILTVNLDRKKDLMEVPLGYMGEIFVVVLFVAVGAHLEMTSIFNAGWAVLAFIVLRSLGNILPMLLLKNKLSLNYRQSLAVGITLFPMAGIAIALLSTTGRLASDFHRALAFIILPAVALLEVIGPMTTTFSLRWVGELNSQKKLDH